MHLSHLFFFTDIFAAACESKYTLVQAVIQVQAPDVLIWTGLTLTSTLQSDAYRLPALHEASAPLCSGNLSKSLENKKEKKKKRTLQRITKIQKVAQVCSLLLKLLMCCLRWNIKEFSRPATRPEIIHNLREFNSKLFYLTQKAEVFSNYSFWFVKKLKDCFHFPFIYLHHFQSQV